jgi:hypothetical protein
MYIMLNIGILGLSLFLPAVLVVNCNAFIPVNVTAKAQLQPQPKAACVPLGVLEYPNGARLVIHSP